MADFVQHYFELPGAIRFQLGLRSPLTNEEQIVMSAYVPGIGSQFSEEAPALPMDLVLAIRTGEERNSFRVHCSSEHRLSHGSLLFRDLSLPVATWMSVYVLLRKLWLERAIFPWHAVAVDTPKGVVLLVGHSGAGKSTIATQLRGTGCTLLTGNKTLVTPTSEGLNIIGGTYCHTLRRDDWSRLGLITQSSIGAFYGDRVAERLDVGVFPRQVTAVYFVKLGASDHCNKVSYPSSLHRLYPLATDSVNSSILLGDGEALVSYEPSTIDMQGAVQKLAAGIKALKEINEICGTADFIASQILKG